jgi:16S rRNA (adenine1518-N6/adenine1519-N6)-dimethyltransferase
VVAVEIDPLLAGELPITVRSRRPDVADRLQVLQADALRMAPLVAQPTVLVANLPYNVAVPVLLGLLATTPTLRSGLVLVQVEVADRLAAAPGSRVYGGPSVKLGWFADATKAGRVGPQVFWPQPHVDSGLVAFTCRQPPGPAAVRAEVFAVVDAAFAQRRKTLRAALASWAGSPAAAELVLRAAGVDPAARGEQLDVDAYRRIAAARGVVDPTDHMR